jgi:hypothetical protein
MSDLDIARQRLHNQLITRQTFEKPDDVVKWLCAVQAQDYAAAKWAVGLRLQDATDESIEQAFAAAHLAFCLTRRYSLDARAYCPAR